MLARLTPIAFLRGTSRGKTQPLILICQGPDGEEIEVVAKFSFGCEQGVVNLAREVIASCLAADLGIKVPEPYLIEATPEWTAALPLEQRLRVQQSCPIAFGCKLITGQFSTWNPGITPSAELLPKLRAIFFFDGMIQNMDRQSPNPNCLVQGNDIFVIDHEIAFTHHLVLGWVPPWKENGLRAFEQNGVHVFREPLRGQGVNFGPIRDTWGALLDDDVDAYKECVPEEWLPAADADVQRAISLIKEVRDNIDGCVIEAKRVLT